MKLSFCILAICVTAAAMAAAMPVVNEIHPAPIAKEPEWVELFNPCTGTEHCCKLTVSDSKTTKIIPDFLINGQCFCILVHDTALFKSIWHVPEETILIQLALPALNNDADCVVLRDSSGRTIDSLGYDSRMIVHGASLERRFAMARPGLEGNLRVSESPDSATPGRPNSVTPPGMVALPGGIKMDSSKFRAEVINNSCVGLSSLRFSFFADFNGNGLAEKNEIVSSCEIPGFPSGSLSAFELGIDSLNSFLGDSAGCRLYFSARCAEDTILRSTSLYYSKPPAPALLLINEVMFDAGPGRSEYIEIYNTEAFRVRLAGWSLCDASGLKQKRWFRISDSTIYIEPRDFALAFRDSSIFDAFPYLAGSRPLVFTGESIALGNTGDAVWLASPSGRISDSVCFYSSWHSSLLESTRDVSLEKTAPMLPSDQRSSWLSSISPDGGTPLRKNSICTPVKKEKGLSAEPNPFSPGRNGEKPVCFISGEIPFSGYMLSAVIYDLLGTKIRQLANSYFEGNQINLIWDGSTGTGTLAPPGKYLLILRASGPDGAGEEKRIIIVIA